MQAARDAQAERARQEKMADRVEARKRLRKAYQTVIPRKIWDELGLKARIEEGDCHSTLDCQGLSAWVVYTTRDECEEKAEFKMRCSIGEGASKVDKLVVPALTDRKGEISWFPKLNRSATTEIRIPLDDCDWLETFLFFVGNWESVIPANKEFLRGKAAAAQYERERAERERKITEAQNKAKAQEELRLQEERFLEVEQDNNAVCSAVNAEVAKFMLWKPITLYHWSYCDGAFLEESDTTCNFSYDNWAITDSLDESGYVTFENSGKTLKLDPQIHKPVIEKVELSNIEDAISYSKSRSSNPFLKPLKVKVNGACFIDKTEYIYGNPPGYYDNDLPKWEFSEESQDFWHDDVRKMPKEWLCKLMGLPKTFEVSVGKPRAPRLFDISNVL